MEDIDPREVCCDKLAEVFRGAAGIELEVAEPIFWGHARCVHCGRLHSELRYATVVGDPFGRGQGETKVSVIALAFVDLDEGAE